MALLMLLCTLWVGVAIGQNQTAPVPMTNAEVIKLAKGGLSNELIVKTIRSRPNQFDLSTDGMLDLKNNSVPDIVIEAMMSGPSSQAGAPASTSSETDNDAFWLYDGDKKIRLEATKVTAEAKAGIGTAFGGAAHGYLTLSEGGPASTIRVTNRNPSFGEIIVPESRRVAELVQLVKLQIDAGSKHRRVETAKVAAFRTTQIGIPETARVPVVFENLGEVTYKGTQQRKYSFKPESPLSPGEYAVVFAGRMFFDFGVD
jgi:hypothetical protein